MKRIFNIDIDVLGVSASVICAVHCALVPLILTFGMLGGMSFLADPFWDFIFIGVALILAMSSLINGYVNHHQNIHPIVIALLGFAAIAVGHLLHHGLLGVMLSISGGLSVAYSHLANYRACRTCKQCRD